MKKNPFAVNHRAEKTKKEIKEATARGATVIQGDNFAALSSAAGGDQPKTGEFNKMHRFTYCVAKAGMENVDQEKMH